MSDAATVLVVDDKESMRDMLEMALTARGLKVVLAEDGSKAIKLAAAQRFDAIISDLKMPRLDGMGLLRELSKLEGGPPPFIMITAHGSVKDAVEAMALGASDFIEKPFDLAELEFKVERAIHEAQPTVPSRAPTGELLPGLIGSAEQLVEIADIVSRAARSSVPVLVLGESGTGKELVARAVHELSPRKDGPFVAVNAGALAIGVMESELFGHEKGAFTGADQLRKGRFETADGGTLFLDELAEIPPSTQVKLLRVLQDKTFERVGGSKSIIADVRLVCATNRNLRELVRTGEFREDLYYRVNVVTVTIPPLRERPGDIQALVRHFLKREKSELKCPDEIMVRLSRYHWPGNVRELENAIRRCLALATDRGLVEDDLPPEILEATGLPEGEEPAKGLVGDLERMEQNQLVGALKETGWNVSRAARILGLGRTALQYKIKKYGISRPDN